MLFVHCAVLSLRQSPNQAEASVLSKMVGTLGMIFMEIVTVMSISSSVRKSAFQELQIPPCFNMYLVISKRITARIP